MSNYKPILLVKLPYSFGGESVISIQDYLDKKISDYHIIVYNYNVEDIEFNVVYDKDLEIIDFNNLRLEITNDILKRNNCE